MKIVKLLTTTIILSIFTFGNIVNAGTWNYYIPGYFGNNVDKEAYNWVDEETLKQLRVALTVKPSGGIASFGKLSRTFDADFIRVENLVNSNILGPSLTEKAKTILSNPLAKSLFINYGPSFLQREHGGNKEQNPSNHQGAYQLYAMESLYTDCRGDTFYSQRSSLLPCSKVYEVYKPYKLLTQAEQDMQALDVLFFIAGKYSSMERNLVGDFDNPYSYKANLYIYLRAVTGNRLSEDQLKKYTIAIINKETTPLVDLLGKEQVALNAVGIDDITDFSMWLEYVRLSYFGLFYNGLGNNYGYRSRKSVYNMLDTAYNSNYPAQNIFFYNIKSDGGGVNWDRPDRNTGLLIIYAQSLENSNKRLAELAALLSVQKANGDLPMTGGK